MLRSAVGELHLAGCGRRATPCRELYALGSRHARASTLSGHWQGRRAPKSAFLSERLGAALPAKRKVKSNRAAAEDASDKSVHSPPQGYTPFEYVTFGDNQLTHELSIEVEPHR